ncbi:YraN family protein [Paenibacillus sp. sgz500958]|uniref:YraN family protein n=1 Tax=Paenibacillus sp. sgz500958 TaxID=3242475 RepID=UPI0036D2FA75
MTQTGSGVLYNRKQKGQAAEEAAVTYLTSLGHTVLARNWRCRSGEIDIIYEADGRLFVVEVRSRSHNVMQGTPEESVNTRKIAQVRSTAAVYLHTTHQTERLLSFEVISVRLNKDLSIASLHHIREAF